MIREINRFIKLAKQSLPFTVYRIFGLPYCYPTYRIEWAITYMCNSRCTHCHIWRVYQERKRLAKDELTTDEVKRVVCRLIEGTKVINLTGGEPTLRSDLPQIIEAIWDSKIGLNVTTNALLPERIKHLVDRAVRLGKTIGITVSVDGPEELHDKLRGIPGNFKKAMTLLTYLKDLSKETKLIAYGISITLSHYNINGLLKLLCLINEMDFDIGRISLTIAHSGEYFRVCDGKSNNTTLPQSYQPFKQRLIKRLEISQELYPKLRSFYLRKHVPFLLNPEKTVIPCMASVSTIFLDPYGNVYPCLMMSSEKWRIGNLRNHDYNLKVLWKMNKNKIINVQRLVKRRSCPKCWMECTASPSVATYLPNLIRAALFYSKNRPQE